MPVSFLQMSANTGSQPQAVNELIFLCGHLPKPTLARTVTDKAMLSR